MAWHGDKDSLTGLNSSILSTPEWRRARELLTNTGMAARSRVDRPERNLVVGKRLLLTRDALRLKQREFAERADVGPASYNQWENGAVYPPVDGAIKLVKAHRITLDWIYLGNMDCLPTHISDAIRALSAAEIAREPEIKIVRPATRKRRA